jgi:hypothetical protein
MSNETAKCNDQPATERSCPDPAGYKCAYCGKVKREVKPDLFDGLCIECTSASLADDKVHGTSKKNKNYNPIPIGNWDL